VGTNYYFRNDEGIYWHVGKSSLGWCFAMHVDKDLKDITDLIRYLDEFLPDKIVDNNGTEYTAAELLGVILLRGVGETPRSKRTDTYLRTNHAVLGPQGLLRYEISVTSRCVGHAIAGLPVDYVAGDFS
jgi:hypothetical protein